MWILKIAGTTSVFRAMTSYKMSLHLADGTPLDIPATEETQVAVNNGATSDQAVDENKNNNEQS